MSVIWHKVWFDLWHNKIRTQLAVGSIAVVVFAIGATFGMADEIRERLCEANELTAKFKVLEDVLLIKQKETP